MVKLGRSSTGPVRWGQGVRRHHSLAAAKGGKRNPSLGAYLLLYFASCPRSHGSSGQERELACFFRPRLELGYCRSSSEAQVRGPRTLGPKDPLTGLVSGLETGSRFEDWFLELRVLGFFEWGLSRFGGKTTSHLASVSWTGPLP